MSLPKALPSLRLFSKFKLPLINKQYTFPGCLCHTDATEKQSLLDGIKVLDLTRVLAGPYCTMVLGDLGADIIKIERPGSGDDTRNWGPPYVEGESAYFLSINRNKQSVCIDMKKREGANIVKKLAAQSDVLIENYLPGKLSQYGLGYDDLKNQLPHLIYCSVTGYGQTGPYKDRAGYDVIAAGVGGLMHITGPEDGGPCRVGIAMTDITTGLYAYGTILAAILHRQRTGVGQHIDCNLLSTQVAVLSHVASNYLNCGQEARRHGTGHPSIVPYQAFKTTDSYFSVGGGNEKHFAILCKLLDLPDLPSDEHFNVNSKRVQRRKEIIQIISDRFAQKSTSEWLSVFEGCGIPYGPINSIQQVFNDPQVLHNDMILEMQHKTVGTVRVPGSAVRCSNSDTVVQHPPPALGEHTDVVLSERLGLDQQQILQLRQDRVIQ